MTEAQVGTAAWQAAVDHGFFIILDLAMGGAFPNAICGCSSPSTSPSSGAHNVYLEFSSGAAGNPPYVSLHYFNFPTA